MCQEAIFICRQCQHDTPASAMKRVGGKVSQPCKACANASQRTRNVTRTGNFKVDPCPACGVAQADHWRCARCTSRGHQMGRGHAYTDLCGWCEAEVMQAAAAQRRAA